MGGGFNLVINKDSDFENLKHLNNPKDKMEFSKLIETFNLVETFRESNPSPKRYTWGRKHPIEQARLYFFSNI